MDIVYKVLITILSIILLVSTGLSITLSAADEIETNNYFSSITETLVDSHYSEEVITSLIEEAQSKGYDLTIQLYGAKEAGAVKYAEVTLFYEFHLDLFGIVIDRVKQKIT